MGWGGGGGADEEGSELVGEGDVEGVGGEGGVGDGVGGFVDGEGELDFAPVEVVCVLGGEALPAAVKPFFAAVFLD